MIWVREKLSIADRTGAIARCRARSGLCRRGWRRPRGRRAADERKELAPLHRADPKPNDHWEYSRSGPCIAAKAARSSGLGPIVLQNSSLHCEGVIIESG